MDNNFDNSSYTGNNQGEQPNYSNNTQTGQPSYTKNTPNFENNSPNYANNPPNFENNQGYYNNTYYSQQPTSQNYGNQGGFQQPPAPANGMAIASLVLGIVSLAISWCWGIGLIPGILAIILGILSRPKTEAGSGKLTGVAVAGIICGSIGSAASILWFIIEAIVLSNDAAFQFRY